MICHSRKGGNLDLRRAKLEHSGMTFVLDSLFPKPSDFLDLQATRHHQRTFNYEKPQVF